ncbi:MAG: phosphatase PAP2 family protein, partial [Chloroflexi bacterium]|nr:phosphatase PAP2 family protein [Chloroflexota bacterium]
YFSYKYVRRPLWRWTMVSIFAALAALMGLGRVIDVEHWPVDVIAGYLISLPLLIALIWLHPRVLSALRDRAPWLYRLVDGERESVRAPSQPGQPPSTR